MSSNSVDAVESGKKKLVGGSKWAFLGRVATALFAFAVNALAARILSPEELGLYFLAVSLVTFASLIAQFGLDRAAIRLISSSMAADRFGDIRQIARKVLIVSLCASVVLASVISVFAESLILPAFNAEKLSESLVWLLIWISVLAIETIIANLFRGFHDIKFAILFSGLLRTCILCMLFAVFWVVMGAEGTSLHNVVVLSVASTVTSMVLGQLLLSLKVKKLPSDGDHTEVIRYSSLVKESWPVMGTALLLFFINQAALWILAAYSSSEDVALYGAAMRLVLLINVANSVVNAVVPPIIAEHYSRGTLKTVEPLIRSAVFVCGIPCLVVLVAFLLFGKDILDLVFGTYYQDAYVVLVFLASGEVIKTLAGPCAVGLSMAGKQAVLLYLSIVRAVLFMGVSFYVVDVYGALGVAIASCVFLVLNELVSLLIAKKMLGIWTGLSMANPFLLLKK